MGTVESCSKFVIRSFGLRHFLISHETAESPPPHTPPVHRLIQGTSATAGSSGITLLPPGNRLRDIPDRHKPFEDAAAWDNKSASESLCPTGTVAAHPGDRLTPHTHETRACFQPASRAIPVAIL